MVLLKKAGLLKGVYLVILPTWYIFLPPIQTVLVMPRNKGHRKSKPL